MLATMITTDTSTTNKQPSLYIYISILNGLEEIPQHKEIFSTLEYGHSQMYLFNKR